MGGKDAPFLYPGMAVNGMENRCGKGGRNIGAGILRRFLDILRCCAKIMAIDLKQETAVGFGLAAFPTRMEIQSTGEEEQLWIKKRSTGVTWALAM